MNEKSSIHGSGGGINVGGSSNDAMPNTVGGETTNISIETI
jgi:hypothetical protein